MFLSKVHFDLLLAPWVNNPLRRKAILGPPGAVPRHGAKASRWRGLGFSFGTARIVFVPPAYARLYLPLATPDFLDI